DDGVECTVDTCDEDLDACTHIAVDRDEDADGISACEGDCDDRNGSTYPGATEICDGEDNNCDGVVDEGVTSECGDCRPGCSIVDMPREVAWTADDDNSAGVTLNPDGTISLNETRTEFDFAWVANTEFATLTKLDTRTGVQAAAYDVALNDGTNGAAPAGERCAQTARGGNCPSRTAVDLRGAVYVANRTFFGQGTVTKVAGLVEDCVDRNGDGMIRTSEDIDGDGLIENSVRGEFLGQDDECILWTVDVGGLNGVPRAVAVAADGSIWVGLHTGETAVQLDAATGRLLRSVDLGSFQPYGAAIASDGTLWFTEAATGLILSVNTATGERGRRAVARAPDGCSGSYGIAIDSRDRVWLAGFQCRYAFRFDPAAGTWLNVSLPLSGAGRGIAADDRGYVYMAASHEYINIRGGAIWEVGDEISRVTRFRADDGSDVRILGTTSAPLPGSGTTGVGLDSNRNIWLVNQGSGSATRVDFEGGPVREYEVGVQPYTYSDFTGFALRTFTAPNGFLRTVVEGCPVGPSEWERVSWEATTPGMSLVDVRVRSAATREGLATAPWVGPFTTAPADLALPPGPVARERLLEVEVNLVSDDASRSPRVRSVSVQLNCPI
ncbi:MAG: hypothetical protein JRH11_21670, partial [Deltaproteobacteria bacterium]|nr:hypothetical protein [Deltaproteobacteria bacterium]